MGLLKVFANLFHFNRTNWKAVTLCLLAACIFWIFNALNKQYSTSIRFPLHFEFDRSKFAPAGPLPQTLLINVKGTGWELFRKYFGVKVPVLTVPVERPAETRKIVASTLPVMLASQMGSIQINHVVLDTIRLNIEPRIYRKFPITVDTSSISFKSEFARISPITITPDSVDLSGPVSVIHDLPDLIVLKLPEKRISNNYRGEVEIDVPDQEFIQRNPPVVEVKFDVGDIITSRKVVKLITESLPWGYVSMQDTVICTFTVPSKVADTFAGVNLYASFPSVNTESLKRGEVRAFFPVIHGIPSYVGLAQVDSVRIRRH